MTDAERQAYALMAGTSLTTAPVDNARACAIIRAARPEDRADVRRMVLERRSLWRAYLAQSQWRWQRETRNPHRARHADSIETRERYVRCT